MRLTDPDALAENLDRADPTDADLMRRVAGGSMPALGELVRRHQQRVRSIAYRMTGRWDLADDIAQETFLRVCRAAAGYSPTASFATWLYRIVMNLCLDWHRHSRRQRARADAAAVERAEESPAPAEVRETVDAVQRAIGALPERQRAVLLLHRYESLSYRQIAEATGWSESAVESLLVRAYAALRVRLAEWK